ncbi:MAG: type II toxin-antitoxin system RelE/ParE family toxin [Myxococcales bacterium]|nr:type II toxin-antitoxin system RelE/ParE family toxin [Myxococcales bacterium]
MTLRLIIEPEAETELEEAADRYEESVPGLGLEFLEEMRQRTRDVLDNPQRFPPFGGVGGGQCAHAVGRFPHLVVYLQVADAVHILAYMHPRQRPGYWGDRVPTR